MWNDMMGYMWSWSWNPGWGWFLLMHLLWWVFVIAGIVALARWAFGTRKPPRQETDPALAILRERYARGEIDKAEFDERKRNLGL